MKKLRVANLDQWAIPQGRIVYHASGFKTHAIEVNPVGPVVVYLTNGKKGHRVLVGVIDEPTEVQFGWDGPCMLELEGEAWVRRDRTPIFSEADPDAVSYTRFEKVGLYHDEIGMALKRQATLQRLHDMDGAAQSSMRAQRLEQELASVNKRLDDLLAAQPKPAEPPVGDA